MEIQDLKQVILFRGMTDEEIRECLTSLSYGIRRFEKGTILLHAGQTTRRMGIVLSGSVTIENSLHTPEILQLSHKLLEM